MENKTIKSFVENNYDANDIDMICQYGCAVGLQGIIYYSETTALYDKFQGEIWEMLCSQSDEQGVSVMELIASFNNADTIGSDEQFKNALVWFAVEQIAYEINECWEIQTNRNTQYKTEEV